MRRGSSLFLKIAYQRAQARCSHQCAMLMPVERILLAELENSSSHEGVSPKSKNSHRKQLGWDPDSSVR